MKKPEQESERLRVVSPVDGSVYAEREWATEREIAAALEKARRAQASWPDSTSNSGP